MTDDRQRAPDDPGPDADRDAPVEPVAPGAPEGTEVGTARTGEQRPAEQGETDGPPATDARAEAPTARRSRLQPTRRAEAAGGAAPSASERVVHIDDRISKIYVLVAIGVFVLILLNALFLGQGGVLTPEPVPTPSPVVTPSPPASPGASPTSSPSLEPSPSPSPATSPPASPTPAPS